MSIGSRSGGLAGGGGAPAVVIATFESPEVVSTSAFAPSGVIAGGPRRMIDLNAAIAAAVTGPRWLHLFDAVALPANGTAPDRAPIFIGGPNITISRDTPVYGDPFATGIVWAISTTQATLTVSATNDAWVDARTIAP